MKPADLDAIVASTTDPAAATLARALREAWAERDSLNDARNVLTDAVAKLTRERDNAMQRSWAAAESRDGTRDALIAMTHERNEANRQRAVAHAALDAVAALLFVPLQHLGYERAKEVLCEHVEELYQQRTAARNEEFTIATAEMRAERAEQERDALRAEVATLTQERDEARAERRAARLDRDAAEEKLAALRGGR